MRTFLFDAISWLFANLIKITHGASEIVCMIYGAVANWLLAVIDKARLQAYVALLEGSSDQEQQDKGQLELKLLNGASQVRDHAKETGDWTEDHTDAIMAIGNALIAELDWEEDYVHQYLREVVESIDGLEYDTKN